MAESPGGNLHFSHPKTQFFLRKNQVNMLVTSKYKLLQLTGATQRPKN